MLTIPLKHSKKWLWTFIIYAISLFAVFIVTRLFLDTELTGTNLLAFAILAIVSALIPCLGGLLGARVFFIVSVLSSIIAVLYMFFIVISNIAPGWEDLTSVISYLVISVAGTTIALISEIISFLVKKYKSRQ